MNTEHYQTHIVKTIDEKLIQDWIDLWERGANPNIFNAYEWFLTCQELFGLKEYELYVCYKDERLVAILPVCSERAFGINALSVLSSRFVVDTAFLLEEYDKELVKHFFKHIISKGNIHLRQMDSRVCFLLKEIFPEMFFSLMSVNPTLSFADDPFLSVSKSTISQIRGVIKKNPDQFSFTLFDGQENLQEHLEMMFTIEQHSSKKIRGMDLFSKQENKDFFQTLSKNHAKTVRIGFLYYNSIPISYQYGFMLKDRFIAYQTAYVNEYAKLRPGKTMLFHLIESLQGKVDYLDLGGGISAYKQEFTQEYRLLYDLYFSKNSVLMQWWKLINSVRRVKQIYFPKKFIRDHEFLFKVLKTNHA